MPVPVVPCVVEALERRSLLTASLSAGGTLAIAGTRRDDAIDIYLNGVRPKHLLVTINGMETVFEAAAVKRIYVNCGLGNDRVRMRDGYGGTGQIPGQENGTGAVIENGRIALTILVCTLLTLTDCG